MANITEKTINNTSYTYDMEAVNPKSLRTKVLAWSGNLVYDKNKAVSVPVDDGSEPSPSSGVKMPVITIAEGGSVTITCATAGATIYYTTDGTTPSKSSSAYSAAFTIANHTTVKAIAYAVIEEEEKNSKVAAKTYSVPTPVVKTPVILPNGGVVESGTTVTITCATDGADIYYTDDGSTPSASSTKYTEAITVTRTTTIKAIGVKEGYDNSAVVSTTYTVNTPTVANPTFSPNGGAVDSGDTVTITCATDGADIYYTDDGSTPSASSTKYTGAITITSAKTIKAIAIKEGYNDSSVISKAFTIKMYKYAGVFNNPDEDTDIEPTSADITSEWLENLTNVTKLVATSKTYGGDGDEKPFTGISEDNGGRVIYSYPSSLGDLTHFIQNGSHQEIGNSFDKLTSTINGVQYTTYVLRNMNASPTLKYAFI